MTNESHINFSSVGRVFIDHIILDNGKRDAEFFIATWLKDINNWTQHPLDRSLRADLQDKALVISSMIVDDDLIFSEESAQSNPRASQSSYRNPEHKSSSKIKTYKAYPPTKNTGIRLQTIPIRLPFKEPERNFNAHYILFDGTIVKPVYEDDVIASYNIPVGLRSAMADQAVMSDHALMSLGRLSLFIDHPDNPSDRINIFSLHTSCQETIGRLTEKMYYFQAISGNLLNNLPLDLIINSKESKNKYRNQIWNVDLRLRENMQLEQALAYAKAFEKYNDN